METDKKEKKRSTAYKKFRYKNRVYIGINNILSELNKETTITQITFGNILKSEQHDRGYYNRIIEYYDILNQVETLDRKTQEYVPVLKHNLEYYKEKLSPTVKKQYRYNKVIYNKQIDLYNEVTKTTEVSFRAFQRLLRHQKSTFTIKDENVLKQLSTIDVFDIKEQKWRPIFDINKTTVLEDRKPIRGRYNKRFDQFFYTTDIFTDTIDNDKVNYLINKSIDEHDIDTFAYLIHDLMIHQLGNSILVYYPLYEDEPEEFAQYTIEVCYERVFIKRNKNPDDWIRFINYRVKQDLINNFRMYNSFEDCHSKRYRNKSSLYDMELDIAIKEACGIGTISYEYIDKKEVINLSLEETIDYLIDNYCPINAYKDSKRLRDALRLSIKRKKPLLNKMPVQYHNILYTLFNEYSKLTNKKDEIE